jgi:hypothetical protein
VVVVPVNERIEKLVELIGDLTTEKLVDSSEQFIHRLSYVHYFGETIKNVPSHIPHEDGKLWMDAITNAVVPRLLNPSKATLDDSIRTTYYTGEWVGGGGTGTSVSLGYFTESYIDFGPYFMFLPLFLWGLFVGFVYRVLIRTSRVSLFGYACATVPIYLNASQVEISNAKMLAGLLLGVLVIFLALKFFSHRLLRLLLQPGQGFEPAALDEAAQSV